MLCRFWIKSRKKDADRDGVTEIVTKRIAKKSKRVCDEGGVTHSVFHTIHERENQL